MRIIALLMCLVLLVWAVVPANAKGYRLKGSVEHPITVLPSGSKTQVLSLEPWVLSKRTMIYVDNARTLEVVPYNIDSTKIKDELVAFRYQYAILWSVLMGISFYLFINRGA